MSNKIVSPKGDITDSMLMASGAPTQQAVTSTESGGKNGRIALQMRGKNLYAQIYETGKGFSKRNFHFQQFELEIVHYRFKSKPAAIGTTTICKMLDTIPFTSTGSLFPISNSDKSGVTKTAVAVDNDVITMLRGASGGSVRKVA